MIHISSHSDHDSAKRQWHFTIPNFKNESEQGKVT